MGQIYNNPYITGQLNAAAPIGYIWEQKRGRKISRRTRIVTGRKESSMKLCNGGITW